MRFHDARIYPSLDATRVGVYGRPNSAREKQPCSLREAVNTEKGDLSRGCSRYLT